MNPRRVILLGSTGSIGTQALDVVERHPDRLRVVGLAAGGTRPDLLAAQARRHRPQVLALADDDAARAFTEALARARAQEDDQATPRPPELPDGPDTPELLVGPTAAAELAAQAADVVLNGITGTIGLEPTLAALRAGTTVALANKESLVAGGSLVRNTMTRPDQIVPVDSEHSAIAQALRAGTHAEIARIVLTASGGPFRGRTKTDLARVTPRQALAHPTWAMGPVVTINSATMVNKALELIEAHHLFDVPAERIDVVVHPASIVHSMVTFRDGATLAQASPPDMRLPIALALTWPHRLPDVARACDFTDPTAWTFEPLDEDTFPAVRLARAALAASPTHPAALNAANEECVAAFLDGRTGFLQIVETLETVLAEHKAGQFPDGVPTLEDIRDAEARARAHARRLIGKGA